MGAVGRPRFGVLDLALDVYAGALPVGISKPKALQISTCPPTKGVISFILPRCSMHRMVRVSASSDSVDPNLERRRSFASPDGPYIRCKNEADEADEHPAVFRRFRPAAGSVLSRRPFLELEAFFLLVTHSVVVHCLKRRHVDTDCLRREEPGSAETHITLLRIHLMSLRYVALRINRETQHVQLTFKRLGIGCQGFVFHDFPRLSELFRNVGLQAVDCVGASRRREVQVDFQPICLY